MVWVKLLFMVPRFVLSIRLVTGFVRLLPSLNWNFSCFVVVAINVCWPARRGCCFYCRPGRDRRWHLPRPWIFSIRAAKCVLVGLVSLFVSRKPWLCRSHKINQLLFAWRRFVLTLSTVCLTKVQSVELVLRPVRSRGRCIGWGQNPVLMPYSALVVPCVGRCVQPSQKRLR